jgi:hypothetical protein
MPRKPNNIGSVKITISTTLKIRGYLENLVMTGLYGKNPTEAAERLIASALERLMREGVVLRTEEMKPDGATVAKLQKSVLTDTR